MLRPLMLLAALASASARAPYIINGRDVDHPGKFPWQASMQMYGRHICGAALISDRWVLTAAHCIEYHPSTYTVVLGAHDIRRQKQGKAQEYKVIEGRRHEYYLADAGQYPHDIALLALAKSAELNECVQIISLDLEKDSFNEQSECYITGWGYMLQGDWLTSPDILQEAPAKVITNDACGQMWGSGKIVPGQICLYNGVNGACMGDSGGPLACRNGPAGPWSLAGVTSWGMANCWQGMPSVYTRVAQYGDWIRTQTGI